MRGYFLQLAVWKVILLRSQRNNCHSATGVLSGGNSMTKPKHAYRANMAILGRGTNVLFRRMRGKQAYINIGVTIHIFS